MIDCLPLYTVFLSLGNVLITLIPVLKDKYIAEFVWPNFYTQSFFYTSLCGLIISLCYRYLLHFSWAKKFYYKIFSIRIPKKIIDATYSQ